MNLSAGSRFFLLAAGILVSAMLGVQPVLSQGPGGDGPPPGYEDEGYADERDGMSDYDMEMDMEMESDYGGRGARSRRGGSFVDVFAIGQQQQLSSTLKNLDLSIFTSPPGTFTPVDAGPVLATEAEQAYKNGNYPLGLELFFAHMAVEYEEANASLQSVKLSQLLKKPVWQVRFGVSYTVRGAIDAEPTPIQEGQKAASPAGRGRGASGRGGGQSGRDEFQGGDDGREDFDDGMMDEQSGFEDEGDPRGRERGSRRKSVSQPTREMLSADANESMNRYLGLVATVVAEEFDSRYRSGDFGPALTSVMPPEPVDPRQASRRGEETTLTSHTPMSQELQDTLADSAEPVPLWKPGIQFFGEADSADVSAKSVREHGIDLLLHFDIFLKEGREGNVQNVSRCRLMHVASGKSMGVSKGIDSYEAISQAKAGRLDHREYVAEQLSTLLGIMDRQVKTIPLPSLSPAVAKRRIGSMLASGKSSSLRSLAEIRLYQLQGSISPEEVETAFDIVGGEDALLMLHGPKEQKLEVAREWALRAVPESDQ